MKTDLPTYALLILAASHIWPDFGAVVHAMTLDIWWLWACVAAVGVYVWLCTPSIDEMVARALASDLPGPDASDAEFDAWVRKAMPHLYQPKGFRND